MVSNLFECFFFYSENINILSFCFIDLRNAMQMKCSADIICLLFVNNVNGITFILFHRGQN